MHTNVILCLVNDFIHSTINHHLVKSIVMNVNDGYAKNAINLTSLKNVIFTILVLEY